MRKLLTLLASLAASNAAASPCDWGCKIRITACEMQRPDRCRSVDKLPDEGAGICPIMMMGVVGEWIAHNPDMVFKSAQCVAPDDQEL